MVGGLLPYPVICPKKSPLTKHGNLEGKQLGERDRELLQRGSEKKLEMSQWRKEIKYLQVQKGEVGEEKKSRRKKRACREVREGPKSKSFCYLWGGDQHCIKLSHLIRNQYPMNGLNFGIRLKVICILLIWGNLIRFYWSS